MEARTADRKRKNRESAARSKQKERDLKEQMEGEIERLRSDAHRREALIWRLQATVISTNAKLAEVERVLYETSRRVTALRDQARLSEGGAQDLVAALLTYSSQMRQASPSPSPSPSPATPSPNSSQYLPPKNEDQGFLPVASDIETWCVAWSLRLWTLAFGFVCRRGIMLCRLAQNQES